MRSWLETVEILLRESKRKTKIARMTFLSLAVLYDNNEETAVLIRALAINMNELDAFIKQEGEVVILMKHFFYTVLQNNKTNFVIRIEVI